MTRTTRTLRTAATATALAIGAVVAAQADESADMVCRGNEPFWSLSIEGRTAVLGRLVDGTVRVSLAGTGTWLDYLAPPLFVWRGRPEPSAGDVVAVITEERCADTMADRTYGWRAIVSLADGTVLTGCCNPAAAQKGEARPGPAFPVVPLTELSARPVRDWSRFLEDFLPAIGSCLAATAGAAPSVTKAWPMNRGMVGVRTRDGEGGRFECIAPRTGGPAEGVRPLAAAAPRRPGDAAVLFTPAPRDPPDGACYVHERIVGENGAPVGWLSYDTC